MRVALVGGTGFIGVHVARHLVERGAEVWSVHRSAAPAATAGVRHLQTDRADAPGFAQALASASPDVVVDMIAYTQPDAEGLLRALPPSVGRLVAVSSADVYVSYGALLGLETASLSSTPSDEDAPLRKSLFPYRARSKGPGDRLHDYEKILVERTAMAWKESGATVLRLPMVYGPGDRQGRVAGYVERFGQGAHELRLNAAEARWRGIRGYVEDVGAAIALAACSSAAAGEAFNLGEPDCLTELEWVQAIARAAGWRGEVVADPALAAHQPLHWEVDLLADTRKLRERLGFVEPVGRDEGLRRTVAAAAVTA